MSEFVDLHLHTSYSDGVTSPSEVVKLAVEHGVAALAITDHDNLDGLDEAFAAAQKNNLKIVSGVEISTLFHGNTVHLLAYGFNRRDGEFNDFLKKQYNFRRDYFVEKLINLNASRAARNERAVDLDDFVKQNGNYYNNAKTAAYLVENGFAADPNAAKDLLRGIPTVKNYVTPAEAIDAAHRAGGLAVL